MNSLDSKKLIDDIACDAESLSVICEILYDKKDYLEPHQTKTLTGIAWSLSSNISGWVDAEVQRRNLKECSA